MEIIRGKLFKKLRDLSFQIETRVSLAVVKLEPWENPKTNRKYPEVNLRENTPFVQPLSRPMTK